MESQYLAYLNRSLTNFRAAVDRRYPRRDKTTDGWIGDEAHQNTSSDHVPDPDGSVDAWDMDVDLRSGDDRRAIEALKEVFQRHPAARYWIHNRQIAHRNSGWARKPYKGSNPHDKHVHWNSNESTEDSNHPWILGDDIELTDKLTYVKADDVKYSSPTTTVGAILPSMHYYVLQVRNQTAARFAELEKKIDAIATKEVTVVVNASEVAESLASNQHFLAALAKAVNDDNARRMAA